MVAVYRETPNSPWKVIPDGLTALSVAAEQWAKGVEYDVRVFPARVETT